MVVSMTERKMTDLPLFITDMVETPPSKVSGHRRIIDLDDLALIPDDAVLLIQYGSKAFKATKASFFGSLGKIYLTDSVALDPIVDGVIEYSNGHLYFTHGDRIAFVGSNGIKITTSTVANTVSETEIYNHILPADFLHSDMRVIFSSTGAFSTDSASETLTVKIKINGVVIHTLIITPSNGTDIAWRGVHEGTIRTDGESGSFIDFSEFSESGVSPIFTAESVAHQIDTTIDNTYSVTVQWGASKVGNSFSCTQGDMTYKH